MGAPATQEQLGKRFAELRKRAGFSQKDAAEKLGLSNETLSRLERGQQWTDFETLAAIANLYGVAFSDLMWVEASGPGAAKRRVVQAVVDALADAKLAEVELVRDVVEVIVRRSRTS
jgi:transcriptional regulator with XRE-family HTH domain